MRVGEAREHGKSAARHALQVGMLPFQVGRESHRGNAISAHGHGAAFEHASRFVARNHQGVGDQHVHAQHPFYSTRSEEPRRMSSTPTSTITATKVSSEAIAVSVGSISKRIVSHIRFGSVVVSGPATKIAMTTSSNEIRKANAAAATIVALIEGSVTYRSDRQKSAPRLRAASSIAGLVVRSAARTMTITSGVAMTVCPRNRANVVSSRW